MSPFMSFAAAGLAALLCCGRTRRLASQPPLPPGADPRRRAIAEAVAAALTVLLVGWLLTKAIAPAPRYVEPAFAILAIGICFAKFRKTMRARSA